MTSVQASQDQTRRGRPRSEQADRAIIHAALEMFAESGAEGLCIEKVAARAGVGKATIYRRWPGKEDLLLDALAALRAPLPQPRGESVRDDLVALLEAMRSESVDPRLIERYVETVVEPRRDVFRAVLRRGVATGELREGTNIEASVDMLTGAVLARTNLSHDRADRGYAKRVVDELLTGMASR
jgi:AcrR family transcriptional regulator